MSSSSSSSSSVPSPSSVAVVERVQNILEKILATTKSATVKAAFLRKLLSSTRVQPSDIQSVAAYLALAVRWLVGPSEAHFECGRILALHIIDTRPFDAIQALHTEFLRTLAPDTLCDTTKTGYVRAICCLLIALKKSGALPMDSVLLRAGVMLNPCQTLVNPNPPISLPSFKAQLAMLEFWHEFPTLVPTQDVLRTDVLVRWIAAIPTQTTSSSLGYQPTQAERERLLSLAMHLTSAYWGVHGVAGSNNDVSNTLQTIFALLIGAPIAMGSTADKIPPLTVPPSRLLYMLVEKFPLQAERSAPEFVAKVAPQLTDEQLTQLIGSILEWPQTDRISAWAQKIIDGICRAKRYTVLRMTTAKHTSALGAQLLDVRFSQGAINVLELLLLGTHTPIAFHSSVPAWGKLLSATVTDKTVQENDSKSDEKQHRSKLKLKLDSATEQRVVMLLYSLMYRFRGHPELYMPIIEELQSRGHSQPNESVLQAYLANHAWRNDDTESSSDSNRSQMPHHKSATGKVGLVNLGNTCFLNSFLQALFVSDHFRTKLLTSSFSLTQTDSNSSSSSSNNNSNNSSSETQFTIFGEYVPSRCISALQMTFAHLMNSIRPAHNPTAFLQTVPSEFRNGRQHDTTEFGKFLLDCIATKLGVQPQQLGSPWTEWKLDEKVVVDEDFGGLQCSTVQCAACGYRSSRVEPFSQFTLDVLDDRKVDSMDDMLQRYFAGDQLTGDNAYYCSECKCKRDAEKKLSIAVPPKHLFVCFKRYKYQAGSNVRNKIFTHVQYPSVLQVPVFKSPQDVDQNNFSHTRYVLYGAIIHAGSSAQCGHYYSVARHARDALQQAARMDIDPDASDSSDQSRWFVFNDSSVTSSSLSFLQNIQRVFPQDVAYCLFYRRANPEDIAEAKHQDRSMSTSAMPSSIARRVELDNSAFQVEQEKASSSRVAALRRAPGFYESFGDYVDPDSI
jgi:ubiquitin C-terminal hydrolase